MKPILTTVSILLIGIVVGFFLSGYVGRYADDLPSFSPDEKVKIILEKGTIIGAASEILPPAKGFVHSQFTIGGFEYFRQFIESPRFALLITTENKKIIEAEIWNRKTNESIFYEVDGTALTRYMKNHPRNQIEPNKSADTTRVSARRNSHTPDTLNLNPTFEL